MNEGMGGEFREGDVIRSRQGNAYEVIRVLGRGERATVYQSRDTEGKAKALKVIHGHVARSPEQTARFLNDAKRLQQLKHENIVQAYSTGETLEARAFVEMQMLSGYTARKLLVRGPLEVTTPPRVLEVTTALRVLIDTTRALAEAHRQGVVHRSLTLDKLFCHYDADDREWSVKVLGFGGGGGGGDGILFEGVLEYAAPEQMSAAATPKADLYALGVLAFELVTGLRPHHEAEERDRQPIDILASPLVNAKLRHTAPRVSAYRDVPDPFDDLVASLLEIDPAKRPADAATAQQELVRILKLISS